MGAVTGPTVVVLAAGSGSRFGGLKQLAEVGADGAAIMDISVRRAAVTGFDRAVLVIAPGMEARVRDHLAAVGEPSIRVDLAVQQLVPGRTRPLGTADAVLAARAAVDGSFVVVNGDDVYPERAFALLAGHLAGGSEDEHALVAFRVAQTLRGDRPVSRAILEADESGALVAIREGTVVSSPDGRRFETANGSQPITDDVCVSMNMWGFRPSIFEPLADAVARFVAEDRDGEAWLPDVVQSQVDAGATVRVLVCEERCFGVTHEADLAAVRSALS
jgi:bifunctional N-acetylglucosamine-1-phosphate-uridyltransferase/glucosamine-1-phosphate-acetyltransferase GlmU-like protein